MMSWRGAKQSLPRAKRGGGNLFLKDGLLRCTLKRAPRNGGYSD
jgi:hypothetical protein